MTGDPAARPSLHGTVSLVTGSSPGIGRATVRKLAAAGGDVCISYLELAAGARELAEVVGMQRRAIVVKADVANPDEVHAMCQIVGEEFGKLDIVVSNAAGGGFRPLLEATVDQLMRSFQVNVAALLALVQAAVPLMRKTSLPRSKLITLSSLGGIRALPSYGLVGAAKGALESMTRQLALELGAARGERQLRVRRAGEHRRAREHAGPRVTAAEPAQALADRRARSGGRRSRERGPRARGAVARCDAGADAVRRRRDIDPGVSRSGLSSSGLSNGRPEQLRPQPRPLRGRGPAGS